MAEPVASAPLAVAALAATTAASMAGVQYMHVVAGIAGGVISLWFVRDAGVMRSWIAIVSGVSLATFGGPFFGPLVAGWAGAPVPQTSNLVALMLATFSVDILAGGRGVMRALPEWLFERITGRPMPERKDVTQ